MAESNPVYVLCETLDGLVAVGPFADDRAVIAWEDTHGTFGRDVVTIESPADYLATRQGAGREV